MVGENPNRIHQMPIRKARQELDAIQYVLGLQLKVLKKFYYEAGENRRSQFTRTFNKRIQKGFELAMVAKAMEICNMKRDVCIRLDEELDDLSREACSTFHYV